MYPNDDWNQVKRAIIAVSSLVLVLLAFTIVTDMARGEDTMVILRMNLPSVNSRVWNRVFPNDPVVPYCDQGVQGDNCIDQKDFPGAAVCIEANGKPIGLLMSGVTMCQVAPLPLAGQTKICRAFSLSVKSYDADKNILVCSGDVLTRELFNGKKTSA